MDYLLNYGIATKPLILLGVSLVAGIASFFFFVFIIKAFKIQTPGRGEKVEVETKTIKGDAKYAQMAKVYLKALGGKANIVEVGNCATRLRLKVKDSSKVNVSQLKKAGAVEVVKTSKSAVQVIVGTTVQYLTPELNKLI